MVSAPRPIRYLIPLLALIACASAHSQQVPELLRAVVGIQTQIPAQARTAPILGVQREGTGVLIDASGLIVTIGYIMLEAEQATVIFADGNTRPATIVGYDSATGFGLLRVQGSVGVTPMELGSARELAPQTRVLAVSFGGPDGVRPAMVMSRREFAGYWEYLLPEAIFTAPPHPAFGGAALLDERGRLVGIGSLAVSDAVAGEYVPGNMFVPIDALLDAMADLLTSGRSLIPRPWLGIYTEETRSKLFVTQVASDGPAQQAGLLRGDIILKVADDSVATMAGFYRKVWALGRPGIEVPLTILRGSEIKELSVTSADRHNWLRGIKGH